MACGNLVNMLLLTKVTNYLDFKQIEGSYVFNGKKEYPTSKVADMLGLRGTVAQTQVRIARLFLNLDRRLFLRLPLHLLHARVEPVDPHEAGDQRAQHQLPRGGCR